MSLRNRWQALSPREQRSITWLLIFLGVVLFWLVAISPALNTLHEVEQRRAQLAQQHAQMLALQAQVQTLKTRPPMSRDTALRSLQGLTPGPQIQLTPQGDRVTAQLKAVPASTLANWLSQARLQAHVLPVEAHLTRGPNANTVAWDGTLILALPHHSAPPSPAQ